MENVKVPENKNAPFIKRTINGQEFTVLIHFRAGCREKAQDKAVSYTHLTLPTIA